MTTMQTILLAFVALNVLNWCLCRAAKRAHAPNRETFAEFILSRYC